MTSASVSAFSASTKRINGIFFQWSPRNTRGGTELLEMQEGPWTGIVRKKQLSSDSELEIGIQLHDSATKPCSNPPRYKCLNGLDGRAYRVRHEYIQRARALLVY